MNSSKKSCQKTNQAVIKVCHGRHCESVGKYILERAEEEISQNSYKNISAEKCPCRANCAKATTVVVEKSGKKNIYNYNYEYWRGNDTFMEKGAMSNLAFGNTREGYENYKKEILD